MMLFSGTTSQYLANVKQENAIARAEAERRLDAETDPDNQCSHGVSLYRSCDRCAQEIGE